VPRQLPNFTLGFMSIRSEELADGLLIRGGGVETAQPPPARLALDVIESTAQLVGNVRRPAGTANSQASAACLRYIKYKQVRPDGVRRYVPQVARTG
jgi:hypothetical protein